MENLDIPPLYRHDDDSDEEAPGDVSDMSWLEYDGRGGFTIRDDDYHSDTDDEDNRHIRASTPNRMPAAPESPPASPPNESEPAEMEVEHENVAPRQQYPRLPPPSINFELYDDRDDFSQDWCVPVTRPRHIVGDIVK